MSYCSNCGVQISDDAEECPSCGAGFTEEQTGQTEEPASYCSNCGMQVSASSEKCPSCGASFKEQPVNHLAEPEHDESQVSLGKTIGSYFTSPFDHFRNHLLHCRQPALGALLVFAGALMIFYLLISLALSSAARYGSGMSLSELMRIGVLLAVMIVVIALFILIIKAIAQAPVDFGRDLLGASFAVSSIILMYILIIFIGLLAADKTYGFDPLGSFERSFYAGSIFRLILTFSCILLCFFKAINSIIQALRNEPVKDVTAYYLAPFILITGIYLGAIVGVEIIGAG